MQPSLLTMPRISFLILAVLLFILPFHGNSQTANTNPEELAILLKIKQYWADPLLLSHWNQSSDQCAWPEITCSGGSVAGISLNSYGILGTIPPFICDLKNLSVLSLCNNSITECFPTVLYNCSKLESLNLSRNHFVGILPGDIHKLSPRLQYLNLGENNFTGDVPPAIGKLTQLKSIYLDSNRFNGSFPTEIGELLNLEELVLSENGFAPQAIPSSFTRLKKLRNFWMCGANLTGEIPQDIGDMKALEYLDLSGNQLSGSIPEGVFQLKNLRILYLYRNRLSGWIPQSLDALNLEVIDLSENSLTGPIPENFGKLTNLTLINVFINELSGEIPAGMDKLPALQDFNLYTNNLSGKLPPEFGRHSKLREFDVSTNNFAGNLPEDLCANGALIGMMAFNNNLTGTLPKSLGNCNTVYAVSVYGNRLSGQIPDGLWTATDLTWLRLSDNSFIGRLPDKVSPKLTILEIGNNQFSGQIPAGVSSWKNLYTFKVSNNHLSGNIPQELTSLAELNILLLDGNQFSGGLPSTIISWKELTVLSCSRNQLSGQIPGALGLLPVLNDLDLSENEFSGEIPTQLGQRVLNFLNLSSNRLTGQIPGAFQNAVFDRSFLANPDLCSNNPSLNLNSCVSKTSNKLSSKIFAAVSCMAALCSSVILVSAFLLIRNHAEKKQLLPSVWKLTSFQELEFTGSTILSNLTENNMIGSGGSGKVYRVPINGPVGFVAVKMISGSNKLDDKLGRQFEAEVKTLGTIRHCSIVKLMCCISNDNSKLLVYEYMENHSLDRWLHGKNRSSMIQHPVLDWPQRLQIAIAAARGLCYMHHDCSPPIIHRDLKSSNILLDSNFNAKIADFGLAKELVKKGETKSVSVVAGSFGYIAPEYAQTRRVNEKIDVYSFGVILLELVTGRRGDDGDETSSLAQWSWHHFREGKPVVDTLDEYIKRESFYLEDICTVFNLGIFCTGLTPSERPTMKEVLQILLRCANPLSQGEKSRSGEDNGAPLLNPTRQEIDGDDSEYSIV